MKRKVKKNIGQYPVVVHADISGGYWVSCPVFDGCYSQGETIEEALANIREAISLCKEEIPKNQSKTPAHVSLHLVAA